MLLAAVDQRGHGPDRQGSPVRPRDQGEALGRQVLDGGGIVQPAAEPGLDGVLTGGGDIG